MLVNELKTISRSKRNEINRRGVTWGDPHDTSQMTLTTAFAAIADDNNSFNKSHNISTPNAYRSIHLLHGRYHPFRTHRSVDVFIP
jgi:hypothetical protein